MSDRITVAVCVSLLNKVKLERICENMVMLGEVTIPTIVRQ